MPGAGSDACRKTGHGAGRGLGGPVRHSSTGQTPGRARRQNRLPAIWPGRVSLHDGSLEQAESQWQQEQERIQKEFETTSRSLNQEWKQTMKEALDTRGTRAQKVDEKGFAPC